MRPRRVRRAGLLYLGGGTLLVLGAFPFFWMLFDQKASAWVLQARSMDLSVGPWTFEASQLQFVNPALMLMLLPAASGHQHRRAHRRTQDPQRDRWRP